MPKLDKKKVEIWLCLVPLFLHIILSIIIAIVSKNLPPLPHLSSGPEEMKVKAMFYVMCYIYYASIIFLFPAILMVRFYVISNDFEGIKKYLRGIKANIVASEVGNIFYLSIVVGGLLFGFTYISKMLHFVVFFPSIIVEVIYMGITIKFRYDMHKISAGLKSIPEDRKR
ncbi:MAG: hypothetical protein PHG90_02715 [Clostridia bacterium]|jgi:hypothetical protein|nr:hypothetical protein [Clostridia bacterium]